MAQRLVQQWAHRRGLPALEALIAGPLSAGQGVEAAEWLRSQSGLEASPELTYETRPPSVQPAVLALVQEALAPVASNAAPAPFAHASLRAWLPDAEELVAFDLPLAS